jgi:hypothetical protein
MTLWILFGVYLALGLLAKPFVAYYYGEQLRPGAHRLILFVIGWPVFLWIAWLLAGETERRPLPEWPAPAERAPSQEEPSDPMADT